MSTRSTLWTEGDDAPIERLDLAVRTYNCLKRSNINSVGQLLALHKTELLVFVISPHKTMRKFGQSSLSMVSYDLIDQSDLSSTIKRMMLYNNIS